MSDGWTASAEQLGEALDRSWSGLLGAARAHPAIALTFSGLGLLWVKAMFVARFNDATVFAILANSSAQSLVFAVTLVVAPVVVVAVVYAASFQVGRQWRRRTVIRPAARFVVATAAVLAIALSALTSLRGDVIWALFVPVIAAVQGASVSPSTARQSHVPPENEEGRMMRALTSVVLLLMLVGMVLVLVDPARMWLPPERITPLHGRPYTGFVLADSGGDLVILREQGRTVVRVPAGSIRGRQYCELSVASKSGPATVGEAWLHGNRKGLVSCP